MYCTYSMCKSLQLRNKEIIFLLFSIVLSNVESAQQFVSAKGLEKYLQPDDVDSGNYDYTKPENQHICTRTCKVGAPPKICYYRFMVESYSSMGPACGDCPTNKTDCFKKGCVTGDGYTKGILVVNRRLPGPSIQVCKDDTVVVDVHNMMPGRTLAIHWHGIQQQGTPYMDGVPMVTQCPIIEDTLFRYAFTVPKPGTYFWHSHDGVQKMDGVEGQLIVRQPKSHDKNGKQYDFDMPQHTMIFLDWMHVMSDEGLPGLHQNFTGQKPQSYLVNGRARLPVDSVTGTALSSCNALQSRIKIENWKTNGIPLSVFHVNKSFGYRFRLIAGTCLSCPYRICFEKHPVTLIAVDGTPVKPEIFNCIDMMGGDRFDVVLHTDQPVGSYWIKVQGLGDCNTGRGSAIIKYKGSKLSEPLTSDQIDVAVPVGRVLNPWNSPCLPTTDPVADVCVCHLRSLIPTPKHILKKPAKQIVVIFDQYRLAQDLSGSSSHSHFFEPRVNVPTISLVNNQSFTSPPSPLLSQFNDVPRDAFCSEECLNRKLGKYVLPCQCTNFITLPMNETIEMIIYDGFSVRLAALVHPFHLHGLDSYLCAQGYLDRNLTLDQRVASIHTTKYLRKDMIVKDTIQVPAGGFIVIRVHTDNPGWWLMHCHFSFHVETGMAVLFRVGDKEDLPPIPKNFLKCGSFLSNELPIIK